ncbi:DUF7551 domain-containing protein [Candidatus Halobonum tyrrellensis]|uniref:Uncharacterized protein n=1 Tax=Candidatus Halobonum tyrrellensis G22 TaxID=1324957 RepID=V4J3L4_9EURY|nr:hypothetical protein [Candidatus Halobonum tyrrellensis]ESP89977.1 hypothetical protein K933_00402 [Candidatus Halobonum tyrrellensis G22]
MVGTTLTEIREHIESLASDDGSFYLVCGRTGERPVPAAGERFDGRATARAALRATEQYRTALRRYDPQLPYYDLIVCEDTRPAATAVPPDARSEREAAPATGSDAGAAAESGTEPSADPERRRLVEFCHRVAAAVFETLSDAEYDGVETAVMDAYFELAETLADPDDLCLCLLECTAAELDARLTPAEQADVLSRAVTRLTPVEPADDPVSATFDRLQRLGLVGEYSRSPAAVDIDAGVRTVVVHLSEYALSPREGRLPVLPVAFDLYRQRRDPPSRFRVSRVGDGWRVVLTFADGERAPDGLASVPIRSEG